MNHEMKTLAAHLSHERRRERRKRSGTGRREGEEVGEEEEEDADGTTEGNHLVLPLSILFLPDLHQFNKLFLFIFLFFLGILCLRFLAARDLSGQMILNPCIDLLIDEILGR